MPVMTKTPNGDDIVILARAEYDALIGAADDADEDAADIAVGMRALARMKSGAETPLTNADLDELLASKSPLAFFRKRRGLSQAALAKQVGVAQGFLSEIENGQKIGDVRTLRKIADALHLSLDDIVPE